MVVGGGMASCPRFPDNPASTITGGPHTHACRSPGLKNDKPWVPLHHVLSQHGAPALEAPAAGQEEARLGDQGPVSPASALTGRVSLDQTVLPDSPQDNGCKRTQEPGPGDPTEAPRACGPSAGLGGFTPQALWALPAGLSSPVINSAW